MKIGIFDSGIGGLSVLHQALKVLPHEQFVYYADEDHVPYGEKTREEIIGYVDDIIQFMVDQDCKAVVIACNTATSAAVSLMREKYDLPIIGMEPAVKKALDLYGDKKVLVAATPITVKGKKMIDLIERFDTHHVVDLIALPGLVRFAEKQEFDSADVLDYLKQCLNNYDDDYHTLVLGCTHFNYFKDSFLKIMPNIHFVDGNSGTVNFLIQNIALENNLQTVDYYYSGRKVEGIELQRIQNYLDRLAQMEKVG